MKTKLTLFVTVLAAALFGMGCVAANKESDGMNIDPLTGLPISIGPGGGGGVDPTTGLPLSSGGWIVGAYPIPLGMWSSDKDNTSLDITNLEYTGEYIESAGHDISKMAFLHNDGKPTLKGYWFNRVKKKDIFVYIHTNEDFIWFSLKLDRNSLIEPSNGNRWRRVKE
jgi:hypothetical protein